jgi:hypothetical protein
VSAKIDVSGILRAQMGTFRGYDRRGRWIDLTTFVVLPVSLGLIAGKWLPEVRNIGGILAGVGVFTALLFGLLVNVLNLSVKLRRDEGLLPETALVRNVAELFVNVAWSVLVGLVVVLLLVVATATHNPGDALGGVWVGVLSATLLHLVCTVVMALVRLWLAHESITDLAPPARKALRRVEEPGGQHSHRAS